MFLKEKKEKFKRIEELKSLSFNIPRFFFLKDKSKIPSLLSWAESLNLKTFNIRTYSFAVLESKQTIHITDLPFEDLESKVIDLLDSNLFCMVDAEYPDKGRISGNLLIEKDDFSFEFVIKEKRAMVRDLNSESFFSLFSPPSSFFSHPNSYSSSFLENFKLFKDKYNLDILNKINLTEDNLKDILFFILKKSLLLKKFDIIIEFTFFESPSGIFFNNPEISFPEKNIVFWEYRRA